MNFNAIYFFTLLYFTFVLLKKIMILLLIILPLVMSCPAPPTTTTTTTTRRPGMLTIPERSTYEVASYDGNSMYPDCPKFFSDCRIVQLNDAALQLMTKNWNADFSFRVSSKWMHLDINKTHELDKYFLTYFSVSILTMMENHRKSLNMASEARYLYIFSRQKFMKNAQYAQYWSLPSNSVTRQVIFDRTQIGGNVKIQMRHFK